MSAQRDSRYATTGLLRDDATGIVFVPQREPFRYRPRSDSVMHVVVGGDTLESLAARFYAGMANAGMLGWVIGDFQPEPILDPTEVLTPGTIIIVPSTTFVNEIQGSVRGATTRLV